MEARATLQNFLSTLGSYSVNDSDTVEQIVENNFASFNDKNMRLLIDCALKERDKKLAINGNDSELLGSWGLIIDTVKAVTIRRRDKATNYLQKLLAIGLQNGRIALESEIVKLQNSKQLDHIFKDLIATSLDECQSSKGNAIVADILKFVQTLCAQFESHNFIQEAKSSKVTSGNELNKSTFSDIDPTIIDGFKECSVEEAKMMKASQLLQNILVRCSGDAVKLKEEITRHCEQTEVGDYAVFDDIFMRVLEDNIEGCKVAQYVNKGKVLAFVKEIILSHKQKENQPDATYSHVSTSIISGNAHHAPQFVDSIQNNTEQHNNTNNVNIEVTILPEDRTSFIDVKQALSALSSSNSCDSNNNTKRVNNKKKKVKNTVKKQISNMAVAASEHLELHGWAVLDNFLPLDTVKRVRVESGLFTSSYEQSEIWVGKHADVGAQLSVPSVRGDKVLWMCGGHTVAAPEGVSREVRTIGEIEPCKLEVKARAPIRRFAAMKELVGACDSFIDEMKSHCASLSGVYERSDAMLAIYPGEGARFAKHIDNSTGDGRRLTCLVYLNPNWKREDGGALRLFPKSKNGEAAVAVDIYPEAGRFAMFYSADIAHEVMPTYAHRHAITMWYYDQSERIAAVTQAKEGGQAKKVATASAETQQQAKRFIAELMGGDDVSEDGGEPTQTELQQLARKVAIFDDNVLEIVSAITGAPSVESFRKGFPLLSIQDLKAMRALFRRMGLSSYTTTTPTLTKA